MITRFQAQTLNQFHFADPGRKSGCAVWRRNGATKLWKRSDIAGRERFRVPIKWGLRNYHAINEATAEWWYSPEQCPACIAKREQLAKAENNA